MQVFFIRAVWARTPVLAVQDGVGGKQYQLKNSAGFRASNIVAYRSGDSTVYQKVNGALITFAEVLSDDAVDTALVPQRTVEARGVNMVIRCGGQEESYPGCSLKSGRHDADFGGQGR